MVIKYINHSNCLETLIHAISSNCPGEKKIPKGKKRQKRCDRISAAQSTCASVIHTQLGRRPTVLYGPLLPRPPLASLSSQAILVSEAPDSVQIGLTWLPPGLKPAFSPLSPLCFLCLPLSTKSNHNTSGVRQSRSRSPFQSRETIVVI